MNRTFYPFNSQQDVDTPLMFCLLTVFLAALIVAVMRPFSSMSWRSAVLLFLVGIVSSFLVIFDRCRQIFSHQFSTGYNTENGMASHVIFAGLFPLVALAFCVRLYMKWIGKTLTAAEKAPGIEGVHAWIRPGNSIAAILIAVCALAGFGASFWAVLFSAFLLLLAYPLCRLIYVPVAPVAAPDAGAGRAERERVLKMLEDGRVTPEECSELLNALGNAEPARAPRTAQWTPQRKLVLTGLALVVVGFFLPWFNYNIGGEVSQVTGTGSEMMPGFLNRSVYVAGGDIPHCLGWCVLVLGSIAALLPYFAGGWNPELRWKAALTGLAAGTLVLVYLASDSLRLVSVGLIVVTAGYVLQMIGTFKERPMAAK